MAHGTEFTASGSLVFVAALVVTVGVLARGAEQASPSGPSVEALKQQELAAVRQLVKDFPDGADALCLLGVVYNGQGNSAEAIKCWERCLALDPNCADACNNMAWVALRKGEFAQAMALWRKALSIDPIIPGARHALVRTLMDQDRAKEAIAVLEEGLRIGPATSQRLYLLGQAHLQLADYEQAKAAYLRAISVQPVYAEAYYGLGVVLSRTGQAEKAKEYLEEFRQRKGRASGGRGERPAEAGVSAVRDQTVQTHTAVGRVYEQRGYLWKAEQQYRAAMEVAPRQADGHRALAQLYLRTRNNLSQAKGLAAKAVELEPIAVNYCLLGQACRANGDLAGALSAVERAVELDPGNAEYRRIYELWRAKK